MPTFNRSSEIFRTLLLIPAGLAAVVGHAHTDAQSQPNGIGLWAREEQGNRAADDQATSTLQAKVRQALVRGSGLLAHNRRLLHCWLGGLLRFMGHFRSSEQFPKFRGV